MSNRLEEDSLDIQDCRCQTYDNAAVMAGCVSGVAQRFLEVNPLAFFSNCDNHTLNLVGVHAVKEVVKMVTFFGTIDSLYKFFSRSTGRWDQLKDCIHLTLKYQCETRWSSRLEAIRPVSQGLEQLIKLLHEMSENTEENAETRSKAQLLLLQMRTFDFLSLLPFWCHCLSLVDIVQKRLQDKSMNFHEAAGDIEALHMHFRDEKTQIVSESVAVGIEMAERLEVSTNKRARNGTTQREQIEAAMNKSLEQVELEFQKRFTQLRFMDEHFGFLLDVETILYSDEDLKEQCEQFCHTYEDVRAIDLISDIAHLRVLCKTRDRIKDPLNLLNFMYEFGHEQVFPAIATAIKLLLTIAVSIASCERSFSKLKLIMTHLRSQLGQTKLSDLAILSIEKETLLSIDFSQMIEQFAKQKARRAPF